MEHLKEPKGVDFIQSKPLTDKDREAISEYIANYKLQNVNRQTTLKKRKQFTKKEKAGY